MKQNVFMTLVLIVAFAISYFIYTYLLPDYIKAGGPLVILLLTLSIMVITFIFERIFTLTKAQGRGSVGNFLKAVKAEMLQGDIDGAIARCDKQRGSAANVLRAGLEKYKAIQSEGRVVEPKQAMEDVQASIQDSMMLEVPLLERNLVVLSTIGSISVLVGLLGTTLGMIRAFRALAKAGAPDAIALSLGISEALINTAGGLITAIMAIVAYNYFFTRIDSFTYSIDEASFMMIKSLAPAKQQGIDL